MLIRRIICCSSHAVWRPGDYPVRNETYQNERSIEALENIDQIYKLIKDTVCPNIQPLIWA